MLIIGDVHKSQLINSNGLDARDKELKKVDDCDDPIDKHDTRRCHDD
jgi:hypothetical protein